LLLRARDGTARLVGATDAGEAVFWKAAEDLRLLSRVPIGGQVSCAAAGPASLDGYFGLMDGRIVRVVPGAGEAEVVVSASGIPTSLAIGDAKGDGVDDIAATVLQMDRSDLVVWLGEREGIFDRDRPRVVLLPGTGRAVLFAPAEDGERLLLLCHGPEVGLSGVSIWSVSEEDSVSGVDLPGLTGKSVHRMIRGDWNGDGTSDLAVLTGGSRSQLEFFLIDAEGRRGRPASAVPVSGPDVGLLVADLDGSGAEDLLVAEGAFRIWLSDGAGRMAALPTPPRGTPTRLGRLSLD
ncbi:MAG: VCBS repeat-containing protein, partial [Candidatus Latescibacterota bacterium]